MRAPCRAQWMSVQAGDSSCVSESAAPLGWLSLLRTASGDCALDDLLATPLPGSDGASALQANGVLEAAIARLRGRPAHSQQLVGLVEWSVRSLIAVC